MTMARFNQILFASFLFLFILVGEYLACGVYFRFAKPTDALLVDGLSLLVAFSFCYYLSRRLIKSALQEAVPKVVVIICYLVVSVLLSLFFRFSVQLVNGVLDPTDIESHLVLVTDKRTSAFGGSIKEGLNPMAHLIAFHDQDPNGMAGELLAPPEIYYFVNNGNPMAVNIRKGLFRLPWVVDYQILDSK